MQILLALEWYAEVAVSYSAKLLQYFHFRPHAGSLDTQVANVYQARVGHAENHEVLVLFVDYQEKIVAARFKAVGPPALIAGSELICGWLEHKTWRELSQLTPEWILAELELSPLRVHIARLIIMAVRQLQYVITGQFSA